MGVVRAQDVMSAPVSRVDVDDSMWDAWTVMLETGVRHLIVCEGDRCVGVLDDRMLFAHWPAGPFGIGYTPVRSLIRARTICVLPETALSRVAAVMVDQGLDVVPVTAPDGTVQGIVTGGDLASAVAHHELVRRDDNEDEVADEGGARCAPW